MHNLLTEPVIRFRPSGGGIQDASLPEVYAALMADGVEAFPSLRPHQRHAWHAFLVQLGAMAVHRAGLDGPPADAGEWRHIIRELTEDWPGDEPWQLVTEDITQPAFMQPPGQDLTNYDRKEVIYSPDSLDMLDTAKNHDLKSLVARDSEAEDWVFALIAMQTMNGQVGRGNYPIARMNSGDGSRTAFSVTPSTSPGAHVRRDIEALLVVSPKIMNSLPFKWDGPGLLWTIQWNGEKEKFPLQSLHPFFIEVCRRRRLLVDHDMRLYAIKAPSEGRFIAAASNRGVVGDPWTLINLADKNGNKALTLQRNSFGYKEITKYLTSGDWERPELSSPMPNERDINLIMRGIRRKKGGQTEGYYERIIPIRSGRLRSAMVRNSTSLDSDDLGSISQARINQIGQIENIFLHAISTFAGWGDTGRVNKILRSRPDDYPLRKKVGEWRDRLDAIIDTRFFDDLQREFEEPDPDERERIRDRWLLNDEDPSGVINHAWALLSEAIDSLPCRAIHYYKARESAEGLFEGRIRGSNGFPHLFNRSQREVTE